MRKPRNPGLVEARIETAIIDLGKPWQYGTNESFNGTFRHECLSVEWFLPSDGRCLASRLRGAVGNGAPR